MKKRFLSLMLALCMTVSLFATLPVTAGAASSGTCGNKLTWTLDDEGTLTISGTGNMTDWSYYTNVPWYSSHGSITSVTIGNSVTSIGDYAFYGCSSLTSVTIPDSVTSISDWAFASCSSLTSIAIPDSVTSIGSGAFGNCSGLTSVTIGNSVTSIADYAFEDCSSLSSVTIPDSVTSIGDSAFNSCNSLTSVTIGNSVTSIGDYAFASCSSLTSIAIPDSVTSISGSAFASCSSLTSINVNSSNNNYNSENGVLFNKNKTTLICCPGGKRDSYTIPDSVTSIGGCAFYYCSGLTSVTIPDSVTSIGYSAFNSCSSLTSVTIPDSVTSIRGSAFSYCSSLTSVIIPDSVTSIGERAFYNCSSLMSVTIPDSVTSIGEDAFRGCSRLSSVTIPDSVTSIGYSAFNSCSSLTSVTIPDSVTSIGKRAFASCSSLTSVTIGESVTSIGKEAFASYSSLEKINWNAVNVSDFFPNNDIFLGAGKTGKGIDVVFGNNVERIPNYAFSGCDRLTSVTIGSSVTSIGHYAFYDCSSLTSVTIPDSVTSIGKDAFRGCSRLSSVTIPDSVTSIWSGAFRGCSGLTSVTIGNSVTSIGSGAFYYCSSLTDVYYTGSEEQWKAISIDDDNTGLTYANIHYNYTSETEKEPSDAEKGYTYNSEHKYSVVLYDDIALENDSFYKITSETDMSFMNHTAGFSDCWQGKFVFVEYKDLEGDEIGLNLLKVYPLKEYVGTVEAATSHTMTLNGVTYDIGENLTYTDPSEEGISIPFYDNPDSYIGNYVCIRTCNSEIVEITIPTWETSDDYILRSFDEAANTISISKGYHTPETYYISQAAQIAPEDINNNVGNYIHYLYDIHENRKAIYNISEYKKPELTYYDTFKPSTWEEVEKAANDFIAASEAYKNGVIELMNSDEDEEAKKVAERRTGAQKLMEKDNNSDSYFLTFSAGTPDNVKIYAYEALYDALAKAHENSDVDLGDIKISGDIISSSTEIVKKITDAFCNLTSFTGTYDKYTVSVHMNSYGVGGALSFFGTMAMRGENGNTIDSNIVICSKTEDIEKAYAVYFSQLKELAENSIEGAMKECVKAFTGKSIDDWGKWGLKHALKKYAPQILSKGAGDVVTAVSTGHDIYKKIKKLVKLNGATPEEKYEAVMKIDWLASMKDDKSVTDKTVDSLYKALKSAATTLESHINSYKNNTEIEKKSKWNWLTSIKCPVDVYVYTKNGNEVGHIVGNDIEYNDDICLVKTGDVKKVYLPNISDYDIKVVAANDGTLNYTVEQYADGNPIGRINFYDIAMTSGDEFISDSNISDITTEHEQVNLIKNSEVISSNEYISSDSTANVTISGTCDGNGNILGLGSYAKGDGVVLTAVPDDGYTFNGWYINEELVSTNIDYSFCVTSEMVITAKFYVNDATYIIGFNQDSNMININSAEAFPEVELTVAMYKDGKFLALKSEKINIAEGENSFESLISDYTGADTLKIMVWESVTSVKPLFTACKVELK